MDGLWTILLPAIGVSALAAGLLLLFRPSAASRLNLPVRDAFPGITKPVYMERYYYRYHRVTGPVTMAGGLILLLIALFLPGIGFFHPYRPDEHLILRDAAAWIAALWGVIILGWGLVVFIRPSALKHVESTANQPVTRERISSAINRVRHRLAAFTLNHPRTAGALVAACGILILLLFLSMKST